VGERAGVLRRDELDQVDDVELVARERNGVQVFAGADDSQAADRAAGTGERDGVDRVLEPTLPDERPEAERARHAPTTSP
jgi:hypothetical protein